MPGKRDCCEEAGDLIQRLLIMDPNKRISLEEVKSHPYFTVNKFPFNLPEISM